MLRSLIVTLALVVGSLAIAGPKVDDAALSALSADARTNLIDPQNALAAAESDVKTAQAALEAAEAAEAAAA